MFVGLVGLGETNGFDITLEPRVCAWPVNPRSFTLYPSDATTERIKAEGIKFATICVRLGTKLRLLAFVSNDSDRDAGR